MENRRVKEADSRRAKRAAHKGERERGSLAIQTGLDVYYGQEEGMKERRAKQPKPKMKRKFRVRTLAEAEIAAAA